MILEYFQFVENRKQLENLIEKLLPYGTVFIPTELLGEVKIFGKPEIRKVIEFEKDPYGEVYVCEHGFMYISYDKLFAISSKEVKGFCTLERIDKEDIPRFSNPNQLIAKFSKYKGFEISARRGNTIEVEVREKEVVKEFKMYEAPKLHECNIKVRDIEILKEVFEFNPREVTLEHDGISISGGNVKLKLHGNFYETRELKEWKVSFENDDRLRRAIEKGLSACLRVDERGGFIKIEIDKVNAYYAGKRE